MPTESRKRSTELGEDTERADVLLRQGVLHTGDEKTDTAGDHGCVDGGGQGILGMVRLVVVSGHGED